MEMQTTVLIVDDEPDIRELIRLYLTNEGYHVLEAADGREALELTRQHTVDLMILDVMMPGMEGMEVCVRIRKTQWMPIIMLTAKTGDLDKIQGLAVGADDYVTKPFNPLELVARVKSQLRRYKQYTNAAPVQKNLLSIGGVTLHPEKRQVWVHGQPVHLTPREFDIVALLFRHPGVVFPSEEIYERVWGEPMLTSNNTIMVHIRKIREKIEDDPKNPAIVLTVWGVGYKAAAHSHPGRDE
ncbi:DNA-binding response regulator [Polycladomyces abyssicola]|uniref:DNA-binding response regulator n=2 Tax=Polycladomyces abyssicola TaxID=1125966 RepID=A0A8D5ZPE4_9BACL|nr:DNA-binding response regulator [Polycladomyces abyssicola]